MNGTKEKKAVWLKRFLNIGGMVAVTALLTWNYFCNPIDKKNYLFGDFEAFLKQTGAIQEPENEEKKEELRQKRKAFLVYSM